MRKLIVYPNCSRGGVSSVIRGRARHDPQTQFDAVFLHDRGGRGAFNDMHNVDLRIVRQDRSKSYFTYLTSTIPYDAISVLSFPSMANQLSESDDAAVAYEFHTSDMTVAQKEIEQLSVDRIERFVSPSEYIADQIADRLPARARRRVDVVPNLVDTEIYAPNGTADFFDASTFPEDSDATPLVWVGRFDKGKGYQHLVRALALLPSTFVAHVVVSLESDPTRISSFLSECDALGVNGRVRVYLNLMPDQLANLFRSARDKRGWLLSTSLMESFGYAVAEAAACDLRVAAFELPVWTREPRTAMFQTVDIGDVASLARIITA